MNRFLFSVHTSQVCFAIHFTYLVLSFSISLFSLYCSSIVFAFHIKQAFDSDTVTAIVFGTKTKATKKKKKSEISLWQSEWMCLCVHVFCWTNGNKNRTNRRIVAIGQERFYDILTIHNPFAGFICKWILYSRQQFIYEGNQVITDKRKRNFNKTNLK